LLSSSGDLLDERPVVSRVEQVTMTMHVEGSSTPASIIEIGDKKPPPSDAERDEAVRATVELEAEAREAAARRRISTAGELEGYLRWRFSCRAGELLLLIPTQRQRDPPRSNLDRRGDRNPCWGVGRKLPGRSRRRTTESNYGYRSAIRRRSDLEGTLRGMVATLDR
jgi:hypothetical protein